MLHILFLAAGYELAMAAEVEGGETMGKDGGAWSNDSASTFAGHENQESHTRDHTDARSVDGDARPFHDVDDGETGRAGTAWRVDDHLDLVDLALDVEVDDLFADRLGGAAVNAAGDVDDAVVLESVVFLLLVGIRCHDGASCSLL